MLLARRPAGPCRAASAWRAGPIPRCSIWGATEREVVEGSPPLHVKPAPAQPDPTCPTCSIWGSTEELEREVVEGGVYRVTHLVPDRKAKR